MYNWYSVEYNEKKQEDKMSRRKTKATPKALEPTGPVHYQASKGQYGPNYAYKASACDILIGWPLRP